MKREDYLPVVAVLFLVGWLTVAVPSSAEDRDLEIVPVGTADLSVPGGAPGGIHRSRGGGIVLLAPKQRAVLKYGPNGAQLRTHQLEAIIPEFGRSRVEIYQDCAVDKAGRILIPAAWRESSQKPVFGVFVLKPDGTYERSIILSPPAESRHIAPGEGGAFYVLGLDTGYFRGFESDCNLVHKYSIEGKRLVSFSGCPEDSGSDLMGQFRQLKQEVDRGQLWTSTGRIYHVLPHSRHLRVFDSDGSPVSDIRFQPPVDNDMLRDYPVMQSTPEADQVWRIVPLATGDFLVQWLHSERRGATRHNLPYLALHDASGEALSRATPLPWKRSALAFADDQGHCYFVRWMSPENYRLVRTKINR